MSLNNPNVNYEYEESRICNKAVITSAGKNSFGAIARSRHGLFASDGATVFDVDKITSGINGFNIFRDLFKRTAFRRRTRRVSRLP